MDRVVVKINEAELLDLIKKYNSLILDLQQTADKISMFKLKVVTIPVCEL